MEKAGSSTTTPKTNIPVDFNSLEDIPESYLWPEDEVVQVDDQIHVPVIDLHGLFRLDEETEERIIQDLAPACQNYGFFQVVNHGVHPELMEKMEMETRRLFSLPLQEKLKAARIPGGVPSGYGIPGVSTFFEKELWCECFTLVGSPEQNAKQLWPQDYRHFCEAEEEFERVMKEVAIKVMQLIGRSFGFKTNEMENWLQFQSNEAFGTVQLNNYPPSPQPLRTMGMGPHTDPSFLTFLYQGAVEGLQYHHNGNWIAVRAVPNALVVHVCDMFQLLSNGRCKSALHRVLTNQSRGRISVAYLWGPPGNALIKPAPQLVDSGHPPLYKSIAKKDYLKAKAKADRPYNVLELFKYE